MALGLWSFTGNVSAGLSLWPQKHHLGMGAAAGAAFSDATWIRHPCLALNVLTFLPLGILTVDLPWLNVLSIPAVGSLPLWSLHLGPPYTLLLFQKVCGKHRCHFSALLKTFPFSAKLNPSSLACLPMHSMPCPRIAFLGWVLMISLHFSSGQTGQFPLTGTSATSLSTKRHHDPFNAHRQYFPRHYHCCMLYRNIYTASY